MNDILLGTCTYFVTYSKCAAVFFCALPKLISDNFWSRNSQMNNIFMELFFLFFKPFRFHDKILQNWKPHWMSYPCVNKKQRTTQNGRLSRLKWTILERFCLQKSLLTNFLRNKNRSIDFLFQPFIRYITSFYQTMSIVTITQ